MGIASNQTPRRMHPALLAVAVVVVPVLYFIFIASAVQPEPESEFDRIHRCDRRSQRL